MSSSYDDRSSILHQQQHRIQHRPSALNFNQSQHQTSTSITALSAAIPTSTTLHNNGNNLREKEKKTLLNLLTLSLYFLIPTLLLDLSRFEMNFRPLFLMPISSNGAAALHISIIAPTCCLHTLPPCKNLHKPLTNIIFGLRNQPLSLTYNLQSQLNSSKS